MRYYYGVYNDYQGFTDVHTSGTLKGALIGLRRLLVKGISEYGMICTEPFPEYLGSRRPKGYVGEMRSGFGAKETVRNINGRKIPFPETVYFWSFKGDRKTYEVLSDGIAIPYKRK